MAITLMITTTLLLRADCLSDRLPELVQYLAASPNKDINNILQIIFYYFSYFLIVFYWTDGATIKFLFNLSIFRGQKLGPWNYALNLIREILFYLKILHDYQMSGSREHNNYAWFRYIFPLINMYIKNVAFYKLCLLPIYH